MGCDIHPVLEKKHRFANGEEKWVAIHDFPFNVRYEYVTADPAKHDNWTIKQAGHNWTPSFDSRNYERFAKLAGVRGDGPAPKGLPDDVSDRARMLSEEADGDGHSHSWCTLREAVEICLGSEFDSANVFLNEEDIRKKQPLSYYFGLEYFDEDNDSLDNYRLVFFFDN